MSFRHQSRSPCPLAPSRVKGISCSVVRRTLPLHSPFSRGFLTCTVCVPGPCRIFFLVNSFGAGKQSSKANIMPYWIPKPCCQDSGWWWWGKLSCPPPLLRAACFPEGFSSLPAHWHWEGHTVVGTGSGSGWHIFIRRCTYR